MHQTLTLCGERVRKGYGEWQMFLPTENCASRVMFLGPLACHRGWGPVPSPMLGVLPKLPNLVPHPSTKTPAEPASQVAAKPAAQLAAGEPIPMPRVEHLQVKYSHQ